MHMPFLVFQRDHFAVHIGDHLRFGIICGPIWGLFLVWGSFAVGDHLRRCTVVQVLPITVACFPQFVYQQMCTINNPLGDISFRIRKLCVRTKMSIRNGVNLLYLVVKMSSIKYEIRFGCFGSEIFIPSW